MALVCLVALTIAADAHAAQFGSRYLRPSCCLLYGGRANIDLVTLNPVTALSLARVETDNAGDYLVQAGLGKSNNLSWANCPSIASRQRYYEALTPSGTSCNIYSDASLTRAAVLETATGSTI